ncbi:Uncharacterised protein [uncultured archaeon]|nr:Uncharacterised protein [uncultured archaeon]
MPGNVVLVSGVRTAFGKFGHGFKDVPAQNPASQAAIYAGIPRHSIIFWYVNHREHRVHIEKWPPSAFSVYSVVDCKYSFFQEKLKNLSIPYDVGSIAINRVCGSGLKAVMPSGLKS